MDTMIALIAVWGLITIIFFSLVFYRSRITKKESDWIPLTDDAKEEKAIETQKLSEVKSHKLDSPIRLLGVVWIVLILVVVGYWFYHGIMTPPPVAR